MAGTTTKGQPTKGIIESVTPILRDGVHETDEYQGKQFYKFNVVFKGNQIAYTMKTADQQHTKLQVGREVEYQPTTWVNDQGTTTLHFASLVRNDSPYGNKRPFTPKGIKQYQAEAVSAAASATANIILVKDSVPAEEFGKWFKAVYNAMNTELKAIFSE